MRSPAAAMEPAGAATAARESRALLGLAGPIVLSQIGQVGMNTMDTIMVGPLGGEALAAVGLASSLHMALLIVATGLILGASPLISQAFGAGDRERCRTIFLQGVWLALAVSLPIVWLNLEGTRIALLVGQPETLSSTVGRYMGALAGGVFPALVFLMGRLFLEGMNRAAVPMAITFVGLAINFFANLVLIYGVGGIVPPYGVVGAGWATTVVRISMALVLLLYLWVQPDIHPFRGIRFWPRLEVIRSIGHVGGPIGVQLGMEVGLFSFAAIMMGWVGTVELGAHQVAINVAATTFMIGLGVSLAGSVRVGQRIGARELAGMRRAVLATYAWTVGFMALCALLFVTIPAAIVGLYTADPRIIELGATLLLVGALFQVFDGAQVAGLNVLRGAADTRVPMWITVGGYWGVGAPVAYLLGFPAGLGPVGIWLGLTAGLAATALVLGLRARRVLWGERYRE